MQISNLLSTDIFMTSGSKLGTHKHKINFQIYPTASSYSTLPTSYQRKDQILYNWLCKNTRFTHSCYIEHTDPPKCTNCNQSTCLSNILTECTSYGQTRHQYYSFTDIKNIFTHTPSQNILNFITEVNLYDQLIIHLAALSPQNVK